MIRGNRHEITNDGWIHDQDNFKVVKDSKSNSEIIIASEKGLICTQGLMNQNAIKQ